MSFPLARQMALKAYFKDDRLDLILEQPNNILGIEYLKALHRNNSPMKAYTIQRKVSGYHDTQLSESCSSASAIRRLLEFAGNSIHLESDGLFDEPTLSETMTRLEGQVPPSCIRLLEESYRKRYPVYSDDFSLLLKYQLMKESRDSLVKYQDVSEELANRIMNCRNDFLHFDQFCGLLKTKELTYSRISRSLFHILPERTCSRIRRKADALTPGSLVSGKTRPHFSPNSREAPRSRWSPSSLRRKLLSEPPPA
jgi:predicted nucleotidyltransferase